jgi:two-component system NarL family response regulator
MSQATTIRVLIADDHAIFRQGLATIINRDPDMALAKNKSAQPSLSP